MAVITPAVDLERANYECQQLLELAKRLAANLDLQTLLEDFLLNVMAHMRSGEVAAFTRASLEIKELTLRRGVQGFAVDPLRRYTLSTEGPLIQELSKLRGPCRVGQLASTQTLADNLDLATLGSIGAEVLAPLVFKGTVHGLILIGERVDRSAYSEQDLEHLKDIATFAAIALHNAYLFDMSSTDLMTHLRMKHYILALLSERVEKRQDGDALSLIILDIDRFKAVNDTYGHDAGDKVIQAVSHCIRDGLRQEDVAARYGGEEFLVMLPGVDLDAAMEIGERLRAKVESYTTERASAGELARGVTISLGIAEFDPARDHTGEDSIRRADVALYKSKEAGRNRATRAQ